MKTTSPVQAGEIGKPEFCRPAQMSNLFGIGRTHSYALIADGKIKSVSLRKRGARFGIRLIDCESVRQYLRSQMEGAQ
jgi:hypothetical protein